MSLLQKFIELHYIGSEQKDLVDMLNKYDLPPILEQVLSAHHSSLALANNLPFDKILPFASSHATLALTTIKLKLDTIQDAEEIKKLKKGLTQMGIRLYLSFIRQFPNDMLAITRLVKDSLPSLIEALGYDKRELDENFNVEQFEIVISEITGERFANEIKPVKIDRPGYRLRWNEKGRLDYLSDEMKARNWIKKKNEWNNLLDSSKTPGAVQCNEKYKAQIVHLLYSLRKNGYVTMQGTKGYFSIAENHFTDYSGRPFPKNSLKRLSSKINEQAEKYKLILVEVEEVMKKISR